MRILVVDDYKEIVDLYKMFLPRHIPNSVIIGTCSPLEAIDLFKEQPFDIVITDYDMPHMDGIELVSIMKSIKNTPVIMMTSYDDLGTINNASEHGVDYFAIKPCCTCELVTQIKRLVQK